MTRTFFILYFASLAILLSQPGCRSAGEKSHTGWTLPTVKLTPFTKDDKVTPPAEKADPQTTAALAKERLNGHNPTVLVRQGEDTSLTPDPEEIAQLSRLEGSQVPQWASESTLAPAPEATASLPSLQIAKNVTPSAMEQVNANAPVSAGTSAPNGISAPNGTPAGTGTPAETALASNGTSQPESLPESISLPETASAPGMVSAPGTASNAGTTSSLPTPGTPASPETVAFALPQELPNVPAGVTQPVPSSGIPAASPAMANGNIQVSASLPTSGNSVNGSHSAAPAVPAAPVDPAAPVSPAASGNGQVQPAALFMPGNIDPRYPNAPARQ